MEDIAKEHSWLTVFLYWNFVWQTNKYPIAEAETLVGL